MEKEIILGFWKKAVERYTERDKKLCDKYKVKSKPVDADEFYTVFEFRDNGVQFTVPQDENYEDYNLTGDALKFAEKYNEIVQDCYFEVDENMEKAGFDKEDHDEGYSLWLKESKEYEVNHYAKKEEDITIRNLKEVSKK